MRRHLPSLHLRNSIEATTVEVIDKQESTDLQA